MKIKSIFFFSALILLLGSCSEHQKVLKSTDLKYKYEKAIEYFEGEEYVQALPLFEELIIVYRGTPRAEKLSYYQAYCDYHLGDLLLASYRFRTFAKTFPVSQWADECLFMSAYCNYLNSPKSSLDQTPTYSAINDMKLFTRVNPESELVDSCNYLIDDLNAKLEQKAFDNAYQYYHMRRHKAAITACENVLEDFPLTNHEEEIRFMILESNYNLASNSVYTKKGDRLKDVEKAYESLKKNYPDSKELKNAESYMSKAEEDWLKLPKELYTLGYYDQASNWSKYILENKQLSDDQKKEFAWMHIDGMYQAAIKGDIKKKRTRLRATLNAYAYAKQYLVGAKEESEATELSALAKNQLDKLHISIPMYYYNAGADLKAINAFDNTLKNYPELEQRDQFMYYKLVSLNNRFTGKIMYAKKLERFETMAEYFKNNQFGEYQNQAQIKYDESLMVLDKAIVAELKSMYKRVTEEYITFASDFENAVAFYQTEKERLTSDSKIEKADKIYESLMKYTEKYQLSKKN